jgi:hypothetical protein
MGSLNSAAGALRPCELVGGVTAGGSTRTGPAQISSLDGGPGGKGKPGRRGPMPVRLGRDGLRLGPGTG